jgi:hypothetical protein
MDDATRLCNDLKANVRDDIEGRLLRVHLGSLYKLGQHTNLDITRPLQRLVNFFVVRGKQHDHKLTGRKCGDAKRMQQSVQTQ